MSPRIGRNATQEEGLKVTTTQWGPIKWEYDARHHGLKYREDWKNEIVEYCVGKFYFEADGSMVIIQKQVRNSIITIGSHQYQDHETACEMAYRMAVKQCHA